MKCQRNASPYRRASPRGPARGSRRRPPPRPRPARPCPRATRTSWPRRPSPPVADLLPGSARRRARIVSGDIRRSRPGGRVRPASRRWEKKQLRVARRAEVDPLDRGDARLRSASSAAARGRGCRPGRRRRRSARRTAGDLRRRPRSSRGRSPARSPRRAAAAERRARRPRRTPPRSPRHPACSDARAPALAVRARDGDGRQSARQRQHRQPRLVRPEPVAGLVARARARAVHRRRRAPGG